MNIVDRTSSTRSITHSRQRGRSGDFLSIYSRRGKSRDLSNINSIVLHQTDFSSRARGNAVDRYDTVIAHFVILRNGTILKVRDLDTRLNNIRSRQAIHFEFVGDFPNARGRGGSELPSVAQIRAGQELVRHLCGLPSIHGQITHIFAHQQVTRISRGNCPGPHIWFNVGRWAMRQLSLSNTIQGARSIPASWENTRLRIAAVGYRQRESDLLRPRQRLAPRPDGILAYAIRQRRVVDSVRRTPADFKPAYRRRI